MKKKIKCILWVILIAGIISFGKNNVYAEGETETEPAPIEYKWWYYEGNYYYADASDISNYTVGWKYIDWHWYYFSNEGKMLSGWQDINGKEYYLGAFNDGAMKSGWQKIDNVWYYFGGTGDGGMKRGWIKDKERWYYLNINGEMLTGWQRIGSRWYLLANDGHMLSGWQNINNRWYYLGGKNDGIMKTGWLKEGGKWYYLNSSGEMVTGWQKIGSTWYLLANDGRMLSGWQKINNSWYYLGGNNDGAMKYGWKYIDSNWYYFGGANDGIMKSGWQYIGNKWYYLYRENDSKGGTYGAMASNRNIDGYYVSKNGDWIDTSWLNSCAQGYSSSTKYLILVDRSSCTVGIYQGSKNNWKLKYFWPCAPGKASTPTISGEYNVAGKGYYFDSGNSRCFYYTQFKGNYLFHSVLYNKNGTLQDGRVGIQLSHGCVRLEINNAKWIYDNIPKGTHVVIY